MSGIWERTPRARVGALIGLLALLAAGTAGPADASKQARGKEAKAIGAAFEKARDDAAAATGIRISTADRSFAAVSYEVVVPDTSPTARLRPPVTAPIPALFEKTKAGKWKPTGKAPKKVIKDLKAKGRTDIRITGDVVAFLHDRASCATRRRFYSAGVYDKLGDTYLSLEFPRWRGYGAYEALGVNSVATLAVGTGGTSYQYETGQGADAFASSGLLYVDSGRWGLIEAGMAHVPDAGGTYPISVGVSGYWVCR